MASRIPRFDHIRPPQIPDFLGLGGFLVSEGSFWGPEIGVSSWFWPFFGYLGSPLWGYPKYPPYYISRARVVSVLMVSHRVTPSRDDDHHLLLQNIDTKSRHPKIGVQKVIQKCNPLKSQSDTTKSRYCKNHPTPQKKGTKQNQYPKSNIPKISLNVYQTDACKINIPKTHIPQIHHSKVGTLDVQNRGPKSDYQRITKSITKIDNKFHDVTKRFHDMTKS